MIEYKGYWYIVTTTKYAEAPPSAARWMFCVMRKNGDTLEYVHRDRKEYVFDSEAETAALKWINEHGAGV